MVNTEVKLRWALISLNVSASTFCVQDNLRNKHRFFYVPFLEKVELVDSTAFIFTSNAKVMQLNLLNNARQFLSTFELLKLKLNGAPSQVSRVKKHHLLVARLT